MVEEGKRAAARGAANESRLLAALLARDFNASKVDLPSSTYDIVVELESREIIRLQSKTVNPSGSVSFQGGTRGGVDRSYVSGVKTYVQNTKTSDAVVGVDARTANGEGSVDFYFVPTVLIEAIGQKSIVTNKVQPGKNNWDLLHYCKDRDQVLRLFGHLL